MDHLKEAKRFACSADGVDITVEWAQVCATLAVAHAQIAMIERRDKANSDAEAMTEREDLIAERQAQRRASERIL